MFIYGSPFGSFKIKGEPRVLMSSHHLTILLYTQNQYRSFIFNTFLNTPNLFNLSSRHYIADLPWKENPTIVLKFVLFYIYYLTVILSVCISVCVCNSLKKTVCCPLCSSMESTLFRNTQRMIGFYCHLFGNPDSKLVNCKNYLV